MDIESSAFSDNGKYFAYCGAGGKLKIWEADKNKLKQEFTPNLHLISPCTCLTWIKTKRESGSDRSPSPKPKKKRKLTTNDEEDIVTLGLASGNILLYSVAIGDVACQLENGHSDRVNSVAWSKGSNLYSCDDNHIVEWSINKRSVISKWKASKTRLTSLAVLPNEQGLLAAGRTIQWWDIKTQKVKQTFTGHAHDVISLTPIVTGSGSDTYFVSTSREDKFINVWSLAGQSDTSQRVASFVTEDAVRNVSVFPGGESIPTTIIAVTRCGVLHVYKRQLNGVCAKPLKPDTTIHIAKDSEKQQSKEAVARIPIITACCVESNSAIVAHGSVYYLCFENLLLNTAERVVCLLRRPSKHNAASLKENSSKLIQPKDEGTEYVPSALSSGSNLKRVRKVRIDSEVPMEERLLNLSLEAQGEDSKVQPQTGSLARLLLQGLNSSDRKIMNTVLHTEDVHVIYDTVMKLPFQAVVPLLKYLFQSVQEKTLMNKVMLLWVQAIVKIHAGQLLASPELADIFSPFLATVESRLSLLTPLAKLRGRLDLVVNQMEKNKSRDGMIPQSESLLTYQDRDSSEEDDDDLMGGIVSNEESMGDSDWEEMSAEEQVMEDGDIAEESSD